MKQTDKPDPRIYTDMYNYIILQYDFLAVIETGINGYSAVWSLSSIQDIES